MKVIMLVLLTMKICINYFDKLKLMKKINKKFLILGDMNELGEECSFS